MISVTLTFKRSATGFPHVKLPRTRKISHSQQKNQPGYRKFSFEIGLVMRMAPKFKHYWHAAPFVVEFLTGVGSPELLLSSLQKSRMAQHKSASFTLPWPPSYQQ